MIPLLVAILIVVGGTLAYVALRNAQDFSDANQILPGVPTNAPKAWAGAHSPEARLHRRLRDAMEAVRANASLDDPALVHVRTDLEQQALTTDERLIAAAALPKGRREEPIRRIGETVDGIEELVASIVELRGPAVQDIERRVDDVRMRLQLVAEAHAELAELDRPSPDLSALRAQLDADAEGAARPGPADEEEGGAGTGDDAGEQGTDPAP